MRLGLGLITVVHKITWQERDAYVNRHGPFALVATSFLFFSFAFFTRSFPWILRSEVRQDEWNQKRREEKAICLQHMRQQVGVGLCVSIIVFFLGSLRIGSP